MFSIPAAAATAFAATAAATACCWRWWLDNPTSAFVKCVGFPFCWVAWIIDLSLFCINGNRGGIPGYSWAERSWLVALPTGSFLASDIGGDISLSVDNTLPPFKCMSGFCWGMSRGVWDLGGIWVFCGGGVRFCSGLMCSRRGLFDSRSDLLSWSCGGGGNTRCCKCGGIGSDAPGGIIPPPSSRLNWASTSSLICEMSVVFRLSFHWFRKLLGGVEGGGRPFISGVGLRCCIWGRRIECLSFVGGVDVGPVGMVNWVFMKYAN